MSGVALCLVRLGRLPEAVEMYKSARKVLSSSFVMSSSTRQENKLASKVTAKLFAMRIHSKAKRAVRKSRRAGNGTYTSKAIRSPQERNEKNVDPRIMVLLKGVERAMHATAKRHNQLLALEGKRGAEDKDGEQGRGSFHSR